MFYSAYGQMFWGFILVYVHINIGPVDILPNFIGYIMIYVALGKLEAQHDLYSKGRIPALIMVFVSIGEMIRVGDVNLVTSSFHTQEMWIAMLCQLPNVINMYLVFCICRGFYRIAEDMGLEEFKELIRFRWTFYLITSASALYITPFMFNLSERWQALLIIILVLNFAAAILFAVLVHRARAVLSDHAIE